MFEGKVVLVTGGTGSFGKAFVKHALTRDYPKKVIVFSRDELKQWEMQNEIKDERLRFFLGDVRDRDRLCRALDGVDVVVHAAALKQVPAAEYNPLEFIKTNVNGSANVIDAALDCGVEKVVALSTDKAVYPANLYGSTKLCSEKLFIAANSYSGGDGPTFSVVRYGNVVGSRGSVVPLFKQIRDERGPYYPITHPEMTRFWITMDQAIDLVKTAIYSQDTGIFVPKIPSARLIDIVMAIDPTALDRLRAVGIRPGEKLHETLIAGGDMGREYQNHFLIGRGNSLKEYRSDTNKHFLSRDELTRLVA